MDWATEEEEEKEEDGVERTAELVAGVVVMAAAVVETAVVEAMVPERMAAVDLEMVAEAAMVLGSMG